MSNTENEQTTYSVVTVSEEDWHEFNFDWDRPDELHSPYNYLADLHDLLLREYHTLHGLKLPRNYHFLDVIAAHESLRAVMPDNDGWWWNSRDQAMVRLHTAITREFGSEFRASYQDSPMPTRPRTRTTDYEPTLQEVEYEIIKRSQPYALRNHAAPLFQNAIAQAERDLKQTYSNENDRLDQGLDEHLEEQQTRHEWGYVPAYYETEEAYQEAQEQEQQQRFEEELFRTRKWEYAHLRLHWLRETQAQVMQLVAAAKKQVYIRTFRGLIKPEDVLNAADALLKLPPSKYSATEPDVRLGAWYAGMLYTCGATDKDLADVLDSYCDWASLVKKIRQNNTNDVIHRQSNLQIT